MANSLHIVGGASDHITAPSLAAYTNDILDIRIRARATWATAGSYNLGGMYGAAGNQAWAVYVAALGKQWIRTSADGTATDTDQQATVIPSIANDEVIWLRWVWNAGAISYYFSRETELDDSAVTWTAHETDTAGIVSIFGSTLDLKFARLTGLGSFTGFFERVVLRTGAGSTVVFDADFTALSAAEVVAGSFTEGSSNAATVTINGSTATYIRAVVNPAATADSESQITVTWDDLPDEGSYTVERSADGSSGWADVSGSLAADVVSYEDTGLDAGTEYFYRIIATYTSIADADPSSTVSATTDSLGGTIYYYGSKQPWDIVKHEVVHKFRRKRVFDVNDEDATKEDKDSLKKGNTDLRRIVDNT